MGIRISEMEEATTFGADDYVPIVTNGTNKKALGQKIKDFIAGFFVKKDGDTMTANLTINSVNPMTISKTNAVTLGTDTANGSTASRVFGLRARDTNDMDVARFIATTNTSGKVAAQIYAQNITSSGTAIYNSLEVIANKDGSLEYNVSDPAAFRTSIGLNVTSGNLTNPDSHVYYSELKRTANQVILYIEMYNFTNQTETIIASIPEAFRPSHRVMFDCLVLSPNVDALRGYARGSVTAAGNITYQNLGNYANGFASITLTWFI